MKSKCHVESDFSLFLITSLLSTADNEQVPSFCIFLILLLQHDICTAGTQTSKSHGVVLTDFGEKEVGKQNQDFKGQKVGKIWI